jgi:hypothetical protein
MPEEPGHCPGRQRKQIGEWRRISEENGGVEEEEKEDEAEDEEDGRWVSGIQLQKIESK